MSSNEHPIRRSIRRIWQPHRGAFWLMLAFNALSSILGWTLHLTQSDGVLLLVLTLLALANAGMGWWLLTVLWREGAATSSGEKNHVQSAVDQQNR